LRYNSATGFVLGYRMHVRARTIFFAAVVLFAWLGFLASLSRTAYAASGTPPPTSTPRPTPTPTIVPPSGPDRFTAVKVPYTLYEWWLTTWHHNNVVCQIFIDREGLPSDYDIYSACGETLYNAWKDTPVCESDKERDCEGYYLQLVDEAPAEREIGLALPPPVVWVSVMDCAPNPETGACPTQPMLRLTGDEPLPNESILRIEGLVDGGPFTCDGDSCEFTLYPTSNDGSVIDFWTYSTYGDTSEKFEARVRVAQEGETWYVDVLSSQWVGTPTASCAETWAAFPPVGGPPDWLDTPDTSEGLASNIPYAYLAGNLIAQGVVEVNACDDSGVLPGGAASPCGLETARDAVTVWQNQFDTLIFDVAQQSGVPAQLLKNIFSQESQFWPGVFRDGEDVGLGQLTDNGADTTLLWNPDFYAQFCPLMLSEKTCATPYAGLSEEHQATLRGALVRSVDATCADCPLGLDLSKAHFSVNVFAETLLANCEQTGRIVRNVIHDAPGKSVSYEDMWRFTLVNYNAGPGCLSDAVQQTYNLRQPLEWGNVAKQLSLSCPSVLKYVSDLSH
jgi:hypothetical protein